VALSGGRIARQFFSETATVSKTRNLALSSVHFFWADERCVPPTDPESNFAIAGELLFAPLAIPEDHIHRIRGEDPPETAATRAETEVCRIAAVNNQGRPALDLIFLGMGEDGHVASLFPGESPEAIANPAVYRPVVAAKPPPHRITLGYQAIADARQVWVLASGPGKEDALRESLSPLGKTPLARVLRSRAHTRIFTDLPS
jgi:6-phosphogluconolactonase